MNGFEKHGLDEGDFEDHSGLGAGLRTFDAFREYNTCILSWCFFSVHDR